MSIAKAFNELAVDNGGQASTQNSIASAIDALTDALAGEDVAASRSIEGAVRLLGEHIGGGGGSQTCVFYAMESYNSQLREPQGTFSVGGTTYQSTTTASINDLTIYGYEVPFGVPVTYTMPSGMTHQTDAAHQGYVYPNMESLENDGGIYGTYNADVQEETSQAVFFPSPSAQPMFFIAYLMDA